MMNWSKQESFADGSKLVAEVEVNERMADISFNLELPQSYSGTIPISHRAKVRVINLISHHSYNYGVVGREELYSPEIRTLELLFSHYVRIFSSVPFSKLTDYELLVLYKSSQRINMPPPAFHQWDNETQALALLLGALTEEHESFLKSYELPTLTDGRSLLYHLKTDLNHENENLWLANIETYNPLFELAEKNPKLGGLAGVVALAFGTKNKELLKRPLRELANERDLDREIIKKKQAVGELLDFPVSTAKFCNYLLDRTGEELAKLFGKVPRSASATSAIAIAEDVLNAPEVGDPRESYLAAHEEFKDIFLHLLDLNAMQLAPEAYRRVISSAQEKHLKELAMAFYKGLGDKDTLATHAINGRLDKLFDEGVASWVTPKARASDVLKSLHSALPPERVILTLEEIIEAREPLTAPQWERFVRSAETYSDLPTGWWKPLVKTVRSTK